MSSWLGNVRAQSKWLATVCGAAAGLQLFSIAGPTGDALVDFIQRIILHYREVFAFVWKSVSNLTSIDFMEFRNQLTFASLILIPYLIRWRRLKISSFSEDNNRLLAFLNFLSITLISSSIYQGGAQFFAGSRWIIWLSLSPIFFAFLTISIWSYRYDPEDRPYLKIIAFSITLALIMVAIGIFLLEFDKISRTYQPITTIFCTLLESIAYTVGILFRIDGYYPFLLASSVFVTIYVINVVLLNAVPAIDSFLHSIGV